MDYQQVYDSEQQTSPQKENRVRFYLKVLVGVLFLAGIITAAVALSQQRASSFSQNKKTGSPVLDTVNFKVDPCDDFYQFACGSWLKETSLPPSVPQVTRSFSHIGAKNDKVLSSIVKQKHPILDEMYTSCMDEESIESKSLDELKQRLVAPMSTAINESNVGKALAVAASAGVHGFFDTMVSVDIHKPEEYLLYMSPNGILLPPDFLLQEKVLEPYYESYMASVFGLFYDSTEAKALARSVFELHENLASAQLVYAKEHPDEPVQYSIVHAKRDLKKKPVPKHTTLADLHKLAPLMGIDEYVEALNISELDLILVEGPELFELYNAVLAETTLETVEAHLLLLTVHEFAEELPSNVQENHFNFFYRLLRGVNYMPERSTTCLGLLDKHLGELLGKYYAEAVFPKESKESVIEMIDLIKEAFLENLPHLSWVDNSTRKEAESKIALMESLIGYPEKIKNYSSIVLSRDNLMSNVLNAKRFEMEEELQLLSQKVDKTRWEMTAPTVNAYYQPTLNTINFPAGIIQPYFFSKNYTPSQNFGGIGMVAGHELSHAFDNTGRLFDGTGLYRNWWTNESAALFEEKASCYVYQYNQFEFAGKNVDGQQTLGENIADNSGLKMAYYAMKLHEKKHGVVPSPFKQFSNEQLYFLAMAQGWCEVSTDEVLRTQILSDVHSPAKARVLGTMRNSKEFAAAYKCPVGSKMNPKDKCAIW